MVSEIFSELWSLSTADVSIKWIWIRAELKLARDLAVIDVGEESNSLFLHRYELFGLTYIFLLVGLLQVYCVYHYIGLCGASF